MTLNKLLQYQNAYIKKCWNKKDYFALNWDEKYIGIIKRHFEGVIKQDNAFHRNDNLCIRVKGRELWIEYSPREYFGSHDEVLILAVKLKAIPTDYRFKDYRVWKIDYKNDAEKNSLGKMEVVDILKEMIVQFNVKQNARDVARQKKIKDVRDELKKFNMSWKEYKHLETLVERVDNGFFDGKELKNLLK